MQLAVTVTEATPGEYIAPLVATAAGTHSLLVTLDGQALPGSPFALTFQEPLAFSLSGPGCADALYASLPTHVVLHAASNVPAGVALPAEWTLPLPVGRISATLDGQPVVGITADAEPNSFVIPFVVPGFGPHPLSQLKLMVDGKLIGTPQTSIPPKVSIGQVCTHD